jgi:hypothetical protein
VVSGVAGLLGLATTHLAVAIATGLTGVTLGVTGLGAGGATLGEAARDRVAVGEGALSDVVLGEVARDRVALGDTALDGVALGVAILGDTAVLAGVPLFGAVLDGVTGTTAEPRVGLGAMAGWSSGVGGCTFFGVATGSSASPVVRFAAVVARTWANSCSLILLRCAS